MYARPNILQRVTVYFINKHALFLSQNILFQGYSSIIFEHLLLPLIVATKQNCSACGVT